MPDYLKTVMAYLTGWVITQRFYSYAAARERQGVKDEMAEYIARELKVALRNDGYLSTREADEAKAAIKLEAEDAAHRVWAAMTANVDPSGLMSGPLTVTEGMIAAALYTVFVEAAFEELQ